MQEHFPAPCTNRVWTYSSFCQIPVVDEARGNHRLIISVAAVTIVETRESAEPGLREGEADLPGAACREQRGGDERGPTCAAPRARSHHHQDGGRNFWEG